VSDDPIRDYVAELGKELGRFARHRRRTLAEVEDHLREAAARIEHTGAVDDEAARQAVERFGSPQLVARQSSASRAKWRAVAVGVLVVAAAAVAVLATPSASHATIPTRASNALVPRVMRSPPAGELPPPGMPIPAGTQIDAYAPLSNGATYVLIEYVWRGWHCDSEYLAMPDSLTPPPNERGGGSSCQRPGSPRRAIDLRAGGGSGQPFILSGTVPQAADQLSITTATGHIHIFLLPHIALHSNPLRQAVILDLTAEHIRSVARLTLLAHGHTLASQKSAAA
jgi:hypothetical protein